jgi:hypothetical protein
MRPVRPWGQPSLVCNEYRVIPRGKADGRVASTTHLHLAPRLKDRVIPLLPICAFMAGYRVNFAFTILLYFVHLILNKIEFFINKQGVYNETPEF